MSAKPTTATEPAEKKPEPAKLYSITYAPPEKRGGAPECLNVGLPNGGVLYMDANLTEVATGEKKDGKLVMRKAKPGDAGFAYAEAILSDFMAKEWAEHYALHGLELKPIAKSALARHPLHNPDEA